MTGFQRLCKFIYIDNLTLILGCGILVDPGLIFILILARGQGLEFRGRKYIVQSDFAHSFG